MAQQHVKMMESLTRKETSENPYDKYLELRNQGKLKEAREFFRSIPPSPQADLALAMAFGSDFIDRLRNS